MAIPLGTAIEFREVVALPGAPASLGQVFRHGNKLWYSDGVRWIDLSTAITVGTAAPPNPFVGQLWVDTN